MTDHYNAFEISPVPAPHPGVSAPDLYRGIYGMPMFITVRTRDIDRAEQFWNRGPGFFTLFSVPGVMVHLRRWAFQDVLLVADGASQTVDAPAPGVTVSFACVLTEIDSIAEHCTAVLPGCAADPEDTPWNTRDLRICAPDGVRIIMTAAKPLDPDSAEAATLADIGITAPDQTEGEHDA
ncbi:glycosyl transferase [Corynebacterium nuruki]|jgi:hypothetical protein|uniref:glycosyl transferase n=1 Tax=Corynebacterium nuruki TaxID=1032851 RepID=UPI0002487274|nr:glycosyl transferase [Corynebacterium nuruki]